MSKNPVRWSLSGLFPALLILCLASLLPLVTGCGAQKGTQAGTVTVSMTANPASVAPGTASTLTVAANHASSIAITGSDGSSYSLPASGGTQSVSPTKTTTYTATATGNDGTATATATVTVTNASPTVTITANPTSIVAGTSSVLTVAATNATTVTVTGTDGSSYTLQSSGGGQTVTPTQTTTYTATATGPGGSATATAQVTVTPAVAPTVTITADPASIDSGQSSTLTVTATNATSVTLSGSDGTTYPMTVTGGTATVTPAKTTTYQATAAGAGGTATQSVTVTVTPVGPPTLTITANPTSIPSGGSSTLTVTASNATQVSVSGSDGSSYTMQPTGGTQSVTPTSDTTYTATATGAGGTTTATATVNVVPAGSLDSIEHVVFMLQENHSFDNYFAKMNTYRGDNGIPTGSAGPQYYVDTLDVDSAGNIANPDDEGTNFSPFPFTSVCIDDESSAWLESYGDVNRYDFSTTRAISMNGFVHNAEGFDKSCASSGSCAGSFTDSTGQRAMGYYNSSTLNYYYYMASQFAISDRWFSPVSSKTVDNRIATFTGGTTQGLTKDPGSDDHLGQLDAETIFQELDKAGVSWKIYYTVTQGNCIAEDECSTGGNNQFPASEFDTFSYSVKYLYMNSSKAPCTAPTQPSSVVGDSSNSFCIDPTHIAPLSDPTYGYFADLTNSNLPSFAFIEAGYSHNDEHPGSSGNIQVGQQQMAKIINAFMNSPEWSSSVFFFSYDEAGGPFDHVPPVPGHSNDYTDPAFASNYPDISSIAVNPDQNNPCLPANGTPGKNPAGTGYCDLLSDEPGAQPTDAPAQQGFAAQLGFRVPNIVISPFVIPHYVSHQPMDHTAVIKFVENRFIGSSASLTARDAAQPNLLNFFDFTTPAWATPPTPPTPATNGTCNAASYGGS